MKSKKVIGILLFDEAYDHLSDALKPYLQKGPIGSYIYGLKAENDGVFLKVTISPELANNRIGDTVEIAIPLRFVKFVVFSQSKSLIGFS